MLGPSPPARALAHPTERRVEQEWPAPHRLRAGNGACAVASWALHIGLGFSVAHENHRSGRHEYLTQAEDEFDGKKKGTRRSRVPLAQSRMATYPLVTTGGGALPLPTCAQPVMLGSARSFPCWARTTCCSHRQSQFRAHAHCGALPTPHAASAEASCNASASALTAVIACVSSK